MIKRRGTLRKFFGDAVPVFFNDRESRGVKKDALASVEMQRKIERGAEDWQSRGMGRALEVRKGIMTGYCGNESRTE